jgi:hypothetical protein
MKDHFRQSDQAARLVPRSSFVLNDAVERIKDASSTQYVYDSTAARLVKVAF